MRDLQDPRVIRAKAGLFGLAGAASAALLWADSPSQRTTFLLVVTVWAWCRLYYFTFHVTERWLGGGRYRGLVHVVRAAWAARNAQAG